MQKGSLAKTISAAEPSTNESGEQERAGGCGGFESILLSSSSSSPTRIEWDNYDERSHDYANITCLPAVQRDRLTKVGVLDSAAPATASLGRSLLLSTARATNEQNKRDEDQTTGEFVVHHMTFDEQPIDASNNNDDNDTIQQTQEVDLATEAGDYCYTTGENTRCNCSGRRRATLTGLIELFEQKVRIEEPKSDAGSGANGAGTRNLRVTKARNRLPLAPESKAAATKISNQTVNKVNNHNISEMRNIITPVKYHSSETEDDDDDNHDEEDDDDGEHELDDADQARLAGNSNSGTTGLARAALHRVATKGVPVLPQPESRKLTDTNWQPPTDSRRYEQLKGGQHSSSHPSRAASCSQRASRKELRKVTSNSLAATRGPPIVKHQVSSSRRLLDQLARLRKLREPNYRIKRPEKVERVESLIDQLERATVEWEEDDQLLDRAERRDWPHQYHERFSEPSAHYPLEAAPELDSRIIPDLDFGCRNDVDSLEEHAIARSHSILNMKQPSTQVGHQSASQVRYVAAGPWSSSLGRPVQKSRTRAFADRYYDDLAVRRLSSKSPTLSHSRLSCLAPDPAMSEVQIDFSSGHRMSYLLCSNAYTPTIEGADWDAVDRRVRNDDLHYRSVKIKPDPHEPPFGIPRQPSLAGTHSSASHYLRYRTNTAARASPNCTCSCACSQHQQVSWKNRQAAHQNIEQAPQKRVSILERASATGDRNRYSGCASVDSGIVREGGTPSSMGERQSTLTRLTPNSPQNLVHSPKTPPRQHDSPVSQQQPDFEYLDTEEVDLDLEFKRAEQDEIEDSRIRWPPCESPALERHKAEIRLTSTRSRPKIRIENPRAKSPLLRAPGKPTASPAPNEWHSPTEKGVVQVQCYRDTIPKPSTLRKPISELECHHNFHDDSEEEPEEEPPIRRIVTTNLDSSDSSPNESSIERYNYRGANTTTGVGSNKPENDLRRNDSEKPLFSIGEYKPLNKPNLKIL